MTRPQFGDLAAGKRSSPPCVGLAPGHAVPDDEVSEHPPHGFAVLLVDAALDHPGLEGLPELVDAPGLTGSRRKRLTTIVGARNAEGRALRVESAPTVVRGVEAHR